MEQVEDFDLDIVLGKVVKTRDNLKGEEVNAFLEMTTMNKLFEHFQDFRQSN